MVTVVPPGVARMGVGPTLVGGAVGGAPVVVVVVGGALAQGETVDPAHEQLQVQCITDELCVV